MNSNTIIIALAALAVVYLIIVFRKASSQSISFINALNPFYTKEEDSDLKKSLQPIIDEIETKRVANFIKSWSDKFEQNRLTVADVQELNAKIAEGQASQVNGILAIHPNGRTLFNNINAELKLKEEALAAETVVV